MENYASLLDTRFRFAYDLNRLAMHSGNPDYPEPNTQPTDEDHAMTLPNGQATVSTVSNAWAVLCTGMITSDSDVVPLVNPSGERNPLIAGVFDSKEKAENYRHRLVNRIAKVTGFANPSFRKGTPIYAIGEVTTKPRKAGAKKGRTISEEQKKKMQAGRKAAQAGSK